MGKTSETRFKASIGNNRGKYMPITSIRVSMWVTHNEKEAVWVQKSPQADGCPRLMLMKLDE